MNIEAVGFVGMLLVVAAWATGLSGDPPPARLAAIYSLGSLLLTIYALSIDDIVFTLLNGTALAFSTISLARSLSHRRKARS